MTNVDVGLIELKRLSGQTDRPVQGGRFVVKLDPKGRKLSHDWIAPSIQ